MTKAEKRRLRRLERRCDWLEARVAIGESRGHNLSYDVAELSALRWAIRRITVGPEQLWDLNGRLEEKIAKQRLVIRNLLAYQQRIAVTDNELDAIVDAASLRDSTTKADVPEPNAQ
jgi:uncharacterized coiled-coil protein SlyX